MATASFQRIARLLDPALSGLPRYLSPVGGGSAGYVPVQKLCAALLGEVRLLASPASLDAMPVSDAVEDVAPQTPLAISKLADQLEPLADPRRGGGSRRGAGRRPAVGRAAGAPTRRLFDAIRAVVAPLESDREPAPDVERVVALIADHDLLASLAASLDGLDLPFLRRFSAVEKA